MKKEIRNKNTLTGIYEFFKDERYKILLLSAISVVVSLLGIGRARCYQIIIDSITEDAATEKSKLVLYSGFFCIIVLASVILYQIFKYINRVVVTNTYNRIRKNCLKALINTEYKAFSQYHTGDIMSRMFSDAKIVAENTADLIPTVSELSVTLLGSAVFLFFISRRFCIILITAGMFFSAFAVSARRSLKKLHNDMQTADGAVRTLYQEQLGGMLMIKVFGAEKNALSSIEKKQSEYRKKTLKKQVASSFLNFGYSVACNGMLLCTFFYAVYGIRKGFLTYGSLTAMLQLAANLQASVTGLGAVLPKLYSAASSAERIEKITSLSSESMGETRLKEVKSISLENVSFSYGRSKVLSNVNLSVTKGETVAIQGASGIGKSTLLMLILGIYKPDDGRVLISDDNDGETPCPANRKYFSFTPQGNGLFSGTIRENILLANDTADEEKISNALKISCSEEFVKALPEGIDTYIGENGFGLSEGQQQRIAIARAVLSDAEVLLFDEATSALDEATEQKLIENLRTVNKTVIIITHRRSPLSICSSAYILSENGIEKVK